MTPTAEQQNLKEWARRRFREGYDAAVHGRQRRKSSFEDQHDIGVGDDFFDFGYRIASVEQQMWATLEDLEAKERRLFWSFTWRAVSYPFKRGIRLLRGLSHGPHS